eukprot:GHRR01019014.1.p1 GENE.GHRR01019014.1~~GHRR01019014.1.p1  ORF type:complete len:326 (+),score=149.69 GHRR01019014.1:847-1824(+)
MRGAGAADRGAAGAAGRPGSRLSTTDENSVSSTTTRQPPPPTRPGAAADSSSSARVSDASSAGGADPGRPPLPPSGAAAGSTGGAGMSISDIIAAAKSYDSALKGKAQELAAMLLKVRPAEEEEDVVLEQLLAASPSTPVGLVALLKEGLDTRGVDVEKRLAGLQPFLEQQISAADKSLIAMADLSQALLGMVGILPDLVEDVPKAPLLVAGVIGHFINTGHLTFGVLELVKAVKEAGADDGKAGGGEDGEEEEELDPPLIDSEKAGPMVLIVINAIKAASGEAAAKSAWTDAGADLASLLPSFAREDADVQQLLNKYDAQYLKQ